MDLGLEAGPRLREKDLFLHDRVSQPLAAMHGVWSLVSLPSLRFHLPAVLSLSAPGDRMRL